MPRTGRPPKLDEIIGTKLVKNAAGDVEQAPITRIEQIVADIRVGLNAERACARAHIDRDTLKDWERTASQVRTGLAQGTIAPSKLTTKQQRCVEFSAALHDAELEWELQANLLLQGLAQGGRKLEVVTTRVRSDGKVETTTKTETTEPDKDVLKWRLMRRFPDIYTERVVIEGTGEDGAIPVEVRARSLAEAVERLAAGVVDADD